MALRSVLTALIVCVLFAVLGEAILRLFKVSVPAFQIGGGIIVLLFSLEMVMGSKEARGNASRSKAKRAEPSLDCTAYPLAIPLMASVSGLVAIVSLLAKRDDLGSLLFLAAVITAIMGINYVCLRSCRYIVRAVGPVALQVVGKIMGVIMTAPCRRAYPHGIDWLGAHRKTQGESVEHRHVIVGKSTRTPRIPGKRILSQSDGSIGLTSPDRPIVRIGTDTGRRSSRISYDGP